MSIAKNGDVFVVTTNGLYFKKNELNTKYIKINNINGTVKEIHFNDKNLFNIIMNGAFIITEYTKINNLRTDLVNIDDDVINLGIIDNNNDDTIFSALKKQNPNLDITQLEIIDKSDYSHFTENYSVKIKIKHNSTKYSYAYDNNILKATIIFNTKDNLNELSNKIRDNLMVKQWLKHVEDYNKNLSTKLENLNTFDDNQKWITKNIEKEIIKSYLRDFSQIIVLIENEWKLNELNNTVAGIKEDINNFKSEIKQLDQKIKDLGNLSASSSNWTCSNVTSLLGAVTSPIPVIGSIASTFFGISSAACAIANK